MLPTLFYVTVSTCYRFSLWLCRINKLPQIPLSYLLWPVAPRCDDECSESSRDVDCSLIRANTADSDIFLRTVPWLITPLYDGLSTEAPRWWAKPPPSRVKVSDFDRWFPLLSAPSAGGDVAITMAATLLLSCEYFRLSSTMLGRRRSSDVDWRLFIMISPDLKEERHTKSEWQLLAWRFHLFQILVGEVS